MPDTIAVKRKNDNEKTKAKIWQSFAKKLWKSQAGPEKREKQKKPLHWQENPWGSY